MYKIVSVLMPFFIISCSVESAKCTKEDILQLSGAGYSKNEISGICDNNERQQNDAKKDSVSGTGEDVIPSTIETPVENAQASVDPGIDLESKANKLYVTASSQMQRIKTGAGNYAKALELYQSARDKIERITSDYAASNIAVALISDQMKIAGVKLSEFEQLESTLQILADAEQDPLMCALFVAGTIKKGYKAHQLSKIAVKFAETRRFEEALETAATISDAKQKAWALGGLSAEYFQTGQLNEASRILSQALDTANHIKNARDKGWVLARIASRQAETGNSDKAIDIAATFKDAGDKAGVLANIVNIYAESGRFALALEVVSSIPDRWDKIFALTAMTDKFSHVKELTQIREVAYKLNGAWSKGEVLANIAGKFVESGEFAAALETAGKIKNTTHKADALSMVADKYAETGQFEIAFETVNTIDDKWGKAAALASLADTLAKSGQFQDALDIAARIELATNKAHALNSIAAQYSESGRKKMAVQIITQAHDTARSINDSIDRTIAFAEIARSYAEVGNFPQALLIAKKINPEYKVSRFVGSETLREKLCFEIATKSAKVGVFSTALEIAGIIGNAHVKVQTLTSIADSYAVSGQKQLALQTLNQALALGSSSIDYEAASPQEWSWAGIVDTFLESGQLVMAVETARSVDYDLEKVELMLKIAGAYEKDGQREKSTQLLTETLEFIERIEIADWKTEALTEIAGKYAELTLQPDEKGKAVLHEIVQASKPVKLQLPWE